MSYRACAVVIAAGFGFSVGSVSGQAIDRDLRLLVADVAPVQAAAVVTPYFAERVPLGVYPALVAVYVDPAPRDGAGGGAGGVGVQADVRATLDRLGLRNAATEPSSVPGWTYVMLPTQDRTPEGAARSVASLSAALDMASLVYLDESGLPVIPTRDLLISFEPTATEAERAAVLATHGATITEHDAAGTPGLIRVRIAAKTGEQALDAALAINDHPSVAWAQSDRIFWAKRAGGIPNDPMFAQQWALEQPNDEDMDALTAWSVTHGDASIRVLVLDSGVQQDHPDISQVPGQTFVGSGGGSGNGNPGNNCDNHGTAVAGCIAATINNGIGITGIAPGVRVQAAKIFNEISLFGFCLPFLESQDSWTAAGINWAADSGVQVTNSSWGGGSASAVITTAFANTRAAGIIHFAATGNDGTGTVGFPANLPTINGVAAMDSTGARASFSTYGPGTFISAPGAAVLTTDRTGTDGYSSGDYTTIDGTSFASPYAAGVAALVLSVNPALTPDEVQAVLAETAVDRGEPGYDTGYGWGFINAGAAVLAVAGSGCAADITGDGNLNFFDLAAYLDLFNAGDPAADLAPPSGTINFFDLAAYLDAFNAGCP